MSSRQTTKNTKLERYFPRTSTDYTAYCTVALCMSQVLDRGKTAENTLSCLDDVITGARVRQKSSLFYNKLAIPSSMHLVTTPTIRPRYTVL